MKLVDVSLKRPVTVFIVTLGVMIFGLVAASRLSVDLLPDISYPSLTIRTDLPDAAPEDVEQFVTRPVEGGGRGRRPHAHAFDLAPGGPRSRSSRLGHAHGSRLARREGSIVTLPREAKRPALLRRPSLDPILRLRLEPDSLQRLAASPIARSRPSWRRRPAAAGTRPRRRGRSQVDVDAAKLSSQASRSPTSRGGSAART
jgi:hypothetical protein